MTDNQILDNLIFYSDEINIRKGGPAGYIANLQEGLQSISNNSVAVLSSHTKKRLKLAAFFASILTKLIFIKTVRKSWRKKLSYRFALWFGCTCPITEDNPKLCPAYEKQLMQMDYKSITCHCVMDFLAVYDFVHQKGLKTKVCLMSHTPEAPSSEIYNNLIACGTDQQMALEIKKKWEKREENAFRKAEVLIFPTAEAMEPYYQTIPDFEDYIKNKTIYFVTTGAKQLKITLSPTEARQKFNVTTKKVVCYLGRHNSVKGYDILSECASKILSYRDDVTFLIGGKQGHEFKAPEHERWKELGWVNPAEVLAAADLFVLPNRRTYFDLVLLEVLSAGVPVIASNTGGNKSAAQMTSVVELFEDTGDLEKRINDFLDGKKEFSREEILAAYQNHFSLQVFARNYEQAVQKIVGAKGII